MVTSVQQRVTAEHEQNLVNNLKKCYGMDKLFYKAVRHR